MKENRVEKFFRLKLWKIVKIYEVFKVALYYLKYYCTTETEIKPNTLWGV